MNILLRKKAPTRIFFRQINRTAHDNFSVSSLNTKSFYHGLIADADRQDSLWKYNPIPSNIQPFVYLDDFLRENLEEKNKYNFIQKDRKNCP